MATDRHVAMCGRCKADLRAAPIVEAPIDALGYQEMADKVIRSGHGEVLDQAICSQEWFEIADFFSALIRRANRSLGDAAIAQLMLFIAHVNPQDLPVDHGTNFEELRARDRQLLTPVIRKLMTVQKEKLIQALRAVSMTRQGLCPSDLVIPRLIREIAEALPRNPVVRPSKTHPRKPGPRARHDVIGMMEKLKRKLAREKAWPTK